MPFTEHIQPVVHTFDGDREFLPVELVSGALEVATNSSPTTVKTLPHSTTLVVSDLVRYNETLELILWNQGAEDFTLAPNSEGNTHFVGASVVPAGGFRLIKIVVGYPGGLGVFVL